MLNVVDQLAMHCLWSHLMTIFLATDDRRSLKELEDQIVNGELSPDDVTDSVQLEEEEVIDSTTPEKQDFKEKQASKLVRAQL